jgi:hypothetical protein
VTDDRVQRRPIELHAVDAPTASACGRPRRSYESPLTPDGSSSTSNRPLTDSPVIDIHVIGGAGWILLVLPAGWTADMDRLSIDWGTTSVKVPREPAAGKPLLVIRGSVGAGRLRLRTPNQRDRRIAERRRN